MKAIYQQFEPAIARWIVAAIVLALVPYLLVRAPVTRLAGTKRKQS